MATQSRGAPYPLATDANNTAADIQALSLWVNERPGVTPATTTQRNAMTGVELWDGRLILNTTLDKVQRYDAGLVTWVTIADQSEVAALLATTGTPAADAYTASRGVAAFAARSDHVHPVQAAEILFAASLNLSPNVANTGDACAAYRRSGVVTLEVYVQCTTATATVLTMPAGWRPPGIIRSSVNLSSNTTERAVNMQTDGTLNVEGGLAVGQNIYGSITYVAA
jgi:hypothetical protein